MDPFKNIGQNKTPKGTCTVIKNGRQSGGHSTKCAYHGAHGLGTLCYLPNITYDTFDKGCFCQFNKSNYLHCTFAFCFSVIYKSVDICKWCWLNMQY